MRKKNIRELQSDFLPTKQGNLLFSYRIRWQMITSVNLKPYRSNIDHLRGGAIPPYGVNRTYDTAVRLGGPRWACPSQSFFHLFVVGAGMQKVVRVHYLSFARNGII